MHISEIIVRHQELLFVFESMNIRHSFPIVNFQAVFARTRVLAGNLRDSIELISIGAIFQDRFSYSDLL